VTRSKNWLLPPCLCLAVLIILPLTFHPTASALLAAWNGVTAYNYCFLILPVSAYLTWERRDALFATTPRPNVFGFALLLLASAVWLLGELSGTYVVSEFALVAMAQSVVLAMLGIQTTRILIFPLMYLLFLVPAGESLIPGLQALTARSAVALLKLTGIPVRSDGLMIYLPNATWIVAEACAGVKFLIASLAVGVLLSGIILRSWRRRAIFLGLSVIVPIVANGFRAFMIVVISYLTNNKYAAGVDHVLYGWVLFAAVLLGMIGIAVAMREADEDELPAKDLPCAPGAPPRNFAIAALSAVFVILSFRAGASSLEVSPANLSMPAALPLLVQRPWAPVAIRDRSPPVFAGADRVWQQAYSDGATTVHLTVGYFASERPGAEAASSTHQFSSAAAILETGQHWQYANVAQQRLYVRTMTFRARHDRRLLWYWMWVDGRYTGSPYLGKLLQLKARLAGGPLAAAVISVSMDYTAAEGPATTALGRFAHSLGDINPNMR
jgi:exosortase A